MKLTTLLNEMTEEQLIKKANDVYKFFKKGTFHKVFAGIECNYKYTLPDKYVVFTNKNVSDGLYAVIVITPDEGMRDDDMKILFEPMDDDSLRIFNVDKSTIWRLFVGFLRVKFKKYRIDLSGRTMIKVIYNGEEVR
jgi:hypothetical protein